MATTIVVPSFAVDGPGPPGWQTSPGERFRHFDVATYDRLRVLTTEFRRLLAQGRAVTVRLGRTRHYRSRALGRRLAWI